MSFLELEGLHVFVTGAAGGIGSAIVDEFLGMYSICRDYNLVRISVARISMQPGVYIDFPNIVWVSNQIMSHWT